MHKETMLYHIYERIANKSLTAWCKIKYTEIIDDYWLVLEEYYELWNVYMDDWNGKKRIEHMVIQCIDYMRDLSYEWTDNFRESICPITINDLNHNYGNNYRIIWHPVMIGDVLDWIYKTWSWKDVFHHFNTIAPHWIEMRKPISEQTIECIEYIYNLLG